MNKASVIYFALMILSLTINNFGQEIHSGTTTESALRNFPFILKLHQSNSDNSLLKGEFVKAAYSSKYIDEYGFTYDYRNKVMEENIAWGLKSISIRKEDEFISAIRKYLGISKDIFALILAILHLAKYH